ncbi:DUF2066 domain-containing protein [Bradyrhizobium sp. Tv2a-2]|uniref:DUF2066 domain-containing protein n=1 Tax=Bradyrhizobium sp. Tv2a-2 TaxID=113395 RepID=UPI0004641B45|nr:DUF2066 domain-containing protein [Bradyrhizobium sp. Tv2a-2]
MSTRHHHNLYDLLHVEGRAVAVAAALVVALSLSLAAAGRGDPLAATADQLYRAQTVVTGQGEANRLTGFAACLEDVVIKVAAAGTLADGPRLQAAKANARDYVEAFSYHDQMSGTPTRDEQGTRDRPYDLTVNFDEAKIDGLLATLGLRPWSSHRPVLAVFVEMEQGARQYIVTSDMRQSDLQRDSLRAAADKRGMPIVLPNAAELSKSEITVATLPTLSAAALAAATAEQGGEIALLGRLVWSDQDLGWATEWRLEWQGEPHRWQLRGITFDEAFRRGISGAAQILSGNGKPG